MIYEYEIITKKIMPGWIPFFEENKELLLNILKKLNSFEYKIYPKPKDIFRALFYYDPKDIKLLILGQDPYIGEENELNVANLNYYDFIAERHNLNVIKNETNNKPLIVNGYFTFENANAQIEINKQVKEVVQKAEEDNILHRFWLCL